MRWEFRGTRQRLGASAAVLSYHYPQILHPEMLQVGTNLQTRVILSEVLEAKDLTLRTKLIHRIKTQSETTTSKPLRNQRRKTHASFLRQTQDKLFASQTSLRRTAFGGCSDFVSLIPKMWVMKKSLVQGTTGAFQNSPNL